MGWSFEGFEGVALFRNGVNQRMSLSVCLSVSVYAFVCLLILSVCRGKFRSVGATDLNTLIFVASVLVNFRPADSGS